MAKLWHRLFVVVFLVLSVLVIKNTYQKSVDQEQDKKDVSEGTLKKAEQRKNGIMVLCYHRIVKDNLSNNIIRKLTNNSQIHEYAIDVNTFQNQLDYLKKRGVRFISMQQMLEMVKKGRPLKHQYAVLTFDDFDQTVHDNGLPILKAYKIPCTVFTVTGITGSYHSGTKLVSRSQIKHMANNRLITVGLHTNNLHYLLHNQSAVITADKYNEFKQDYRESQKLMVHYLGKEAAFFAYPYGSETPRVQRYLDNRNVTTFSLNIGLINEQTDITHSLPRTMIDKRTWHNVVVPWVK